MPPLRSKGTSRVVRRLRGQQRWDRPRRRLPLHPIWCAAAGVGPSPATFSAHRLSPPPAARGRNPAPASLQRATARLPPAPAPSTTGAGPPPLCDLPLVKEAFDSVSYDCNACVLMPRKALRPSMLLSFMVVHYILESSFASVDFFLHSSLAWCITVSDLKPHQFCSG